MNSAKKQQNTTMIKNFAVPLGLLLFLVCLNKAQSDPLSSARYFVYAGESLQESGDFKDAARHFRQAYELSGDWTLLLDLARCEELAKRKGLALVLYEEYLSQGKATLDNERVREVEAKIALIRLEVGYLEFKPQRNFAISIDETPRGSTLARIPVTGGVEHKLAIGRMTERKVTVPAGETVLVDLGQEVEGEDVAVDKGRQPEIVGTPRRKNPLKISGWVLTAVGGAALIGSAITGGLAKAKDNLLADSCSGNVCPPELGPDLETRDNLAMTTDILWISGSAIMISGIVLWIVGSKKERKRNVSPHLTGITGPRTAGILFVNSF